MEGYIFKMERLAKGFHLFRLKTGMDFLAQILTLINKKFSYEKTKTINRLINRKTILLFNSNIVFLYHIIIHHSESYWL